MFNLLEFLLLSYMMQTCSSHLLCGPHTILVQNIRVTLLALSQAFRFLIHPVSLTVSIYTRKLTYHSSDSIHDRLTIREAMIMSVRGSWVAEGSTRRRKEHIMSQIHIGNCVHFSSSHCSKYAHALSLPLSLQRVNLISL